MDKVFVKRHLERQPFHMAAVEIIIPFHGQHQRVAKLMEQIFTTVTNNRYQITLVDDGSPLPSEGPTFLQTIEKAKLPGVVCMRLDGHKGFGAAVNHVLRNPKHAWIPWVLIMHSDVELHDAN